MVDLIGADDAYFVFFWDVCRPFQDLQEQRPQGPDLPQQHERVPGLRFRKLIVNGSAIESLPSSRGRHGRASCHPERYDVRALDRHPPVHHRSGQRR